MRVGSTPLNGSVTADPSVGLRQEYKAAKKERDRNLVGEFKESLVRLPTVLFVEERGSLSIVCDRSSPVYARALEEYADLSRLEATVKVTKQVAWTIALQRDAKSTCEIYDRLVRDLQTRLWFITHANARVMKSFKFWHADKARKALVNVLAPVVAYKKALARIEDYERALKPIAEMVHEYRADDLLSW